jgi:hypothetical protein
MFSIDCEPAGSLPVVKMPNAECAEGLGRALVAGGLPVHRGDVPQLGGRGGHP